MPIYEYICQKCGEHFDHLWTSIAAADRAAESGAPACPNCDSRETDRLVSRVAVLGELGGLTPSEQQGVKAEEERKASITPREQIDKLQANRAEKRRSGQT